MITGRIYYNNVELSRYSNPKKYHKSMTSSCGTNKRYKKTIGNLVLLLLFILTETLFVIYVQCQESSNNSSSTNYHLSSSMKESLEEIDHNRNNLTTITNSKNNNNSTTTTIATATATTTTTNTTRSTRALIGDNKQQQQHQKTTLLTSETSNNIIQKRQASTEQNDTGGPANRGNDQWFLDTEPGPYSLKPYRFVYNVRGKNGQTEQYRREIGDGRFLSGSYGYILPDGIYRHVDYVADDRGFRAFIRTTEPGTANQNPADVVINSNPKIVYPSPGQNYFSSQGLGTGGIGARFGSRPPLLNNTSAGLYPSPIGGGGGGGGGQFSSPSNGGQFQSLGVRPIGGSDNQDVLSRPINQPIDIGRYSPVIDYNYNQQQPQPQQADSNNRSPSLGGAGDQPKSNDSTRPPPSSSDSKLDLPRRRYDDRPPPPGGGNLIERQLFDYNPYNSNLNNNNNKTSTATNQQQQQQQNYPLLNYDRPIDNSLNQAPQRLNVDDRGERRNRPTNTNKLIYDNYLATDLPYQPNREALGKTSQPNVRQYDYPNTPDNNTPASRYPSRPELPIEPQPPVRGPTKDDGSSSAHKEDGQEHGVLHHDHGTKGFNSKTNHRPVGQSFYSTDGTKTRLRMNPPYQEFSSMDRNNQQPQRPSQNQAEPPTAEASPKFDDDPYQTKSIGLPTTTTTTTSATTSTSTTTTTTPKPQQQSEINHPDRPEELRQPAPPIPPEPPIPPRPPAMPELPSPPGTHREDYTQYDQRERDRTSGRKQFDEHHQQRYTPSDERISFEHQARRDHDQEPDHLRGTPPSDHHRQQHQGIKTSQASHSGYRGSDLMALSLKNNLRNTRMPPDLNPNALVMMNADWPKSLQNVIGLPQPPRNHFSSPYIASNHHDEDTSQPIGENKRESDHSSSNNNQHHNGGGGGGGGDQTAIYFDALRLSSTKKTQAEERLSELEKFRQRLKSQQLLLDQARVGSSTTTTTTTPTAPPVPSTATLADNASQGNNRATSGNSGFSFDRNDKRAKSAGYLPNSFVSYDDESEDQAAATSPGNITTSNTRSTTRNKHLASRPYSSNLHSSFISTPHSRSLDQNSNESNNGKLLEKLEESLSRDSSKPTSQLASSNEPEVIKTEIERRLSNLAAQFQQNWPSLDHHNHLRKALHHAHGHPLNYLNQQDSHNKIDRQDPKGLSKMPNLAHSLLLAKQQKNQSKDMVIGGGPKVTNFSYQHISSSNGNKPDNNHSGLLSSSILKAKQQELTTSHNLTRLDPLLSGKHDDKSSGESSSNLNTTTATITSDNFSNSASKEVRVKGKGHPSGGNDKDKYKREENARDRAQQRDNGSARSSQALAVDNNNNNNNDQFNMNLINSLTSLTASHINPFVSPASGQLSRAPIMIASPDTTEGGRAPTSTSNQLDGHFATSSARYYTPPELLAISDAYNAAGQQNELNSLRSALGLDVTLDGPRSPPIGGGYANNHRLGPINQRQVNMETNNNDLTARSSSGQPSVTPNSFENLAMITSEASRSIQNGHRPNMVDRLFSGDIKIVASTDTPPIKEDKTNNYSTTNRASQSSSPEKQLFGFTMTPSSSTTTSKYTSLPSTTTTTTTSPQQQQQQHMTTPKPLVVKRLGGHLSGNSDIKLATIHQGVASQIFSLDGMNDNGIITSSSLSSSSLHHNDDAANTAKNHRYNQPSSKWTGQYNNIIDSHHRDNHKFIEVVSPVEGTSFQAFKDAELSISAVSR